LLLNVGVSMLPHVSAAAHVGGGVAGALSALLLQMHRYGSPARKTLAGLGLALVPTLFLLGLATAFDRDPRLQPFVMAEYREQIDQRVGSLPVKLGNLETQADILHLQPANVREAGQVSRTREGLRALVKQAKEELDWVKRSTPSTPTRPLRERGQALIDALIPFAEALEKHAGGEVVPNMVELRKNWQDAGLAWTKVAAK